MLHFRSLSRLLQGRSIHFSRSISQKFLNENGKPSTQVSHFKDEEDITSVQERALFEQVFENIMKKEELRKKNSNDVFLGSFPFDGSDLRSGLEGDGKGLQVVFEKKSHDIHAEDKKLFDFFKNTSGSSHSGDIGESAKLTTDDIRNYPVSLVSSIFADNNEIHTTTTEAPPSKKLLANILESPLRKTEIDTPLNLKLDKKVLKKLEAKEKFKAAMDNVLKPYLVHLSGKLQTDFELLEHVQILLQQYSDFETTSEKRDAVSPDNLIESIRQQSIADNTTLPRPYRITLPYILVKLLTSEHFNFPSERSYAIASYIYRECKKCPDISLYLNVCNVDFYNLLLKLCWDNFREIFQLRQLTTEMSINGIRGDIYTVEILNKVAQELRHMNDDILDMGLNQSDEAPRTVGVVWCRENSIDLMVVENYLKKLKDSLI